MREGHFFSLIMSGIVLFFLPRFIRRLFFSRYETGAFLSRCRHLLPPLVGRTRYRVRTLLCFFSSRTVLFPPVTSSSMGEFAPSPFSRIDDGKDVLPFPFFRRNHPSFPFSSPCAGRAPQSASFFFPAVTPSPFLPNFIGAL